MAESNMSSFELLILTSAVGSMSRTHATAELARWSNCPGRYSTARYFLPSRSHSSFTQSVTISPNTA